MNVAVIPARGGSKRIPRKNIRTFCGRPMIAYSIEAARQSDLFDRIIVSTDDEEIAAIAAASGAEIPFMRPQELADDFISPSEAVKHAIRWLIDHGSAPTHVCCIYPTAPFIDAADLRTGHEKLVQSGKSYVFSVTSFPFPVQRAVRINVDGEIEAMYPEFVAKRSQDIERAFHDAGQFYWALPEAFLNDVPIFSQASIPVILDRHRVQDIDTEEDWLRAELMFQALNLERGVD